jgi:hypothetical protein
VTTNVGSPPDQEDAYSGAENAMQALVLAVKKYEYFYGDDLPGLIHLRTEILDHRRWTILYLDVYQHPASDTIAGLFREEGATENQPMSERSPEVVSVEVDPQPHYRIRRGV